jgi:transcription-repair coupling factor (superfamily II helicase)
VKKIIQHKKTMRNPAYAELLEGIARGEKRMTVSGLTGSAKAFVLAASFRSGARTFFVICPAERDAKELTRDLTLLLGPERVFFYPPWDVQSVDMFAFQQEVELERANILSRLLAGERIVVVAPLKAVLQKVTPRRVFDGFCRNVSIGDDVDRDAFAEDLLDGGYRRVSLVEERGEFSIRGNIIDVFVPCAAQPVRMELVGDELESLRVFDPASQRSVKEIAEYVLCPARELILSPDRRVRAVRNIRARANELGLTASARNRLVEVLENGFISSINPLFLPLFHQSFESGNGKTATAGEELDHVLAYLPSRCLVVVDDLLAVAQAVMAVENQLDRSISKAAHEQRFFLERQSSHCGEEELREELERFPRLDFSGLILDGADEEGVRLKIHTEEGETHAGQVWRPETEEGLFKPLAERIRSWQEAGDLTVFVCAGQEDLQRISFLLGRYHLNADVVPALRLLDEIEGHSGDGRLILVEGRITRGFRLPSMKFGFISGEEIFGKKVIRGRPRPVREGYFLRSFGELKEGDYVVHTDHGIGRYRGLQKLSVGAFENDFLVIEYQENDRLYIPIDRLDRIQRYIGADEREPKLDKLGGQSWETAKERVTTSIREVAEELVAIYAAREVMERNAFAPPDDLYEEFSSTFEFEETPDQARAIEDVHEDMNAGKPMDRLICGDAGFGKTEVALRASFRAVMDGKQVAVLVPTTILAEQHYQTFTRRLESYPVRVEVLNRMRTKAEQKRIAEDITRGIVDIAIGTHRLLQDDVKFKDLGLVVIDEEQRFGVAHKEKLKKLRTLVDVLTLTATPIPRTLHLSLVGIRDLSIINTPPEDRRPVTTYVLEFDEDVIVTAIRREMERDGQIFLLHDRVRSIYTMARLVGKLLPEARVAVVHGQMKPREIEEAMTKFVKKEFHVLVCTSIIAAGLDIPSANTIIVNRADRFGLAQLYQIRGRVGRAREEAYAYLLVPKGAMLSADARKRLQVITELSEPGSGFRISANDLEMRGAGNLLGVSQSGHISAVGYELYTELMERTIRELRGEPSIAEELKPEINLGVPAFIPEDYVADVQRRLVLYKRISVAVDDGELARIRDDLSDCYGPLPPETENLLEIIALRNLLQRIRVKKMGWDGKHLSLAFCENSPVDPLRLVDLSLKKHKGMRFGADYRLTVPLQDSGVASVIATAKELLTIIDVQ